MQASITGAELRSDITSVSTGMGVLESKAASGCASKEKKFEGNYCDPSIGMIE